MIFWVFTVWVSKDLGLYKLGAKNPVGFISWVGMGSSSYPFISKHIHGLCAKRLLVFMAWIPIGPSLNQIIWDFWLWYQRMFGLYGLSGKGLVNLSFNVTSSSTSLFSGSMKFIWNNVFTAWVSKDTLSLWLWCQKSFGLYGPGWVPIWPLNLLFNPDLVCVIFKRIQWWGQSTARALRKLR